MGPILRYTAARVVLFGAAVGVLYLLGARGLLLFGLAIIVSGLVSFIALSRQRDVMSSALVGRYRDFKRRLDEGAAREDDASDVPADAADDARRRG
ncbi:MAG: DUF4229 domain-containing protein [Streptosporangiales bacterium]|nr:DUF4229 domain-containing protein [Streptosporangiales bacterium]